MSSTYNQNNNQNIGTALINDVTRDNLSDISSDFAEITLDHFLNEGFIKELPFTGTAIKLFKAGIGLRESIFLKKVYKLLSEIKDIPPKKRQEYINKSECDPKYKHKVGEKLLMIIDQIDDMDKPGITGKLFKPIADCIHDPFRQFAVPHSLPSFKY